VGLAIENLCLFYEHLVYFTAIGYNLWSFGIYLFPRFGMFYQEKSGNPGTGECLILFSVGSGWMRLRKISAHLIYV
jgi:hypothetical protein